MAEDEGGFSQAEQTRLLQLERRNALPPAVAEAVKRQRATGQFPDALPPIEGQGGGNALSRAYGAVAGPITQGVALAGQYPPLKALQAGASALTGGAVPMPTPMSSAETAQAGAEFLVPQTPTQLAILAGTGGAGGLAAKAGLKGVTAAGTRIAGATAGGAAGAAAEGQDVVTGAEQGAIAGAVGETLGALSNWIVPRLPGGKGRVIEGRAAALGNTLEELGVAPTLAQARTSKDFYKIASQPMNKVLGPAKEEKIQAIEGLMGNKLMTIPALSPTLNKWTLRKANEEMSKIAELAFKDNPLDRTIGGRDARELWGEIAGQIETELTRLVGPAATKIWNAAQQQYARGAVVMEILQSPTAFKSTGKGAQLNIEGIQQFIGKPRQQADMTRMGTQALEDVNRAFTGGAGAGYRDYLPAGEAGLTSAGREAVRAPTGAGTFIGLPLRTALPGAGATFAGPVAGQMGASGRVATDYATLRALYGLGALPEETP